MLTVFSYLLAGRHDSSLADLVDRVTYFVIKRTNTKILRRILTAIHVWSKEPLHLIDMRYTDNPAISGDVSPVTLTFAEGTICELLAALDMQPSPPSPGDDDIADDLLNYEVRADNVVAWTRLLSDLLDTLALNSLSDPSKRGLPKEDARLQAASNMYLLATLLRSPLMTHVLTSRIITSLNEHRAEMAANREKKNEIFKCNPDGAQYCHDVLQSSKLTIISQIGMG